MRRRPLVLAGSFLVLCTFAIRAGDQKKTPWKVTAELEEACSCDPACPCWFGSKPTHMQCGGGQVIFIQKGSYSGVALDGLAFGVMGQSPRGDTMSESLGRWDFLTIYIDEKANPEQRKALEAIARATTPPAAPAERTAVRYVPITRRIQGKEHVITLGNVGSFSGHLFQGEAGGAPRIASAPEADPIHREYQQGQTTRQTYTDSGQKWDWGNSNYMYATFETDSAAYDRYTAAMMQRMKEEEKKAEAKK
jgi:hypothetical protein